MPHHIHKDHSCHRHSRDKIAHTNTLQVPGVFTYTLTGVYSDIADPRVSALIEKSTKELNAALAADPLDTPRSVRDILVAHLDKITPLMEAAAKAAGLPV